MDRSSYRLQKVDEKAEKAEREVPMMVYMFGANICAPPGSEGAQTCAERA